MKARYKFVPTHASPDFVVFDHSAPAQTGLADGTHGLFAFLDVARLVPELARFSKDGDLVCTYRPELLPTPPSEASTVEVLMPLNIRCNSKTFFAKLEKSLPRLRFVECETANLKISSMYNLIPEADAKDRSDVMLESRLGGTCAWFAENLSPPQSFLFQFDVEILNKYIKSFFKMETMDDATNVFGFVDKVEQHGDCGFCLVQGRN